MGRYSKGDHVKIEAVDGQSGESEWMWLLVERSDDRERLVFGTLDSEPIVATDMCLGQGLAVSYDNIREHREENWDFPTMAGSQREVVAQLVPKTVETVETLSQSAKKHLYSAPDLLPEPS